MKYAFDTNIIILILRDIPEECQNFNAAVRRGDQFIIPPLVHYEIRRGFRYKYAPMKEKAYCAMTTRYPIGEMNVESLEHAAAIYADLRRAGRTVDDMDLLIAAFCIQNDYTLITRNIKHFDNINVLKIDDWAEH